MERAAAIDVEAIKERVGGLAPCMVCGGEAEIVQFGREGNGVWVGCCRSPECCRFIEYHGSGWSAERAAIDWNRRNSGIRGAIRAIKLLWRFKFGEVAKERKREEEIKRREREDREARMREVFGIKEGNGKRNEGKKI